MYALILLIIGEVVYVGFAFFSLFYGIIYGILYCLRKIWYCVRMICGRKSNEVNAVVTPACGCVDSFFRTLDRLFRGIEATYVVSNSNKICFSLSTSKNSVCAICLEQFLDKKMNV